MSKHPELDGWENFDKISKVEFDALVKAKSFQTGPFLDTFGDGEYEPYMPNRQAFGILKSGRRVRAWVRGEEGE